MYITVVNTVSNQEIYLKLFFLHEFATICMFNKDIINGGHVMSEGRRA